MGCARKLGFSYDFDLRLSPTVTLEGFSFRTFKFERAKAETSEKLSGASAELERHSRDVTADLPARVAALAGLLAEKILGRKVAA